jgi:hypothetical protein
MSGTAWIEIIERQAAGAITREEMIDQLGNYLLDDISALRGIVKAIKEQGNDYLSHCADELTRTNQKRFDDHQRDNRDL